MAHGEAEYGCAQGEPCRLGHHEQYPAGRSPRRACAGGTHDIVGRCAPAWTSASGDLPPERVEEEPVVPRQRTEEPERRSGEFLEPAHQPQDGCRSELRGWAGAHRHGRVRPGSRRNRRERPPRRWC